MVTLTYVIVLMEDT